MGPETTGLRSHHKKGRRQDGEWEKERMNMSSEREGEINLTFAVIRLPEFSSQGFRYRKSLIFWSSKLQ